MRSRLIFGLIVLLLLIPGCGGSGSTTTPPPPSIGQIYVAKALSNSILVFKAGDNGNVAPQRTIVLPDEPSPLSLDVTHDRLATTTNDILHSVVLVDNVSNQNCCVNVRVISGAATTLHFPRPVALDGTANLVYVVDSPNILVFGPASSIAGNVAPLRTIVPPFVPGGIAVDPAANRLFVSDDTNNAVAIYDNASTVSGAASPSRTISGSATQIVAPGPLALDSTGRLLVNNTNPGTTLLVFNNAGSASGNVAPSQVITLPTVVAQVAVTATGDLYQVDFAPEVRAFANAFSASGPIQVRMITGSNTTLDGLPGAPPIVGGVAVDPTR